MDQLKWSSGRRQRLPTGHMNKNKPWWWFHFQLFLPLLTTRSRGRSSCRRVLWFFCCEKTRRTPPPNVQTLYTLGTTQSERKTTLRHLEIVPSQINGLAAMKGARRFAIRRLANRSDSDLTSKRWPGTWCTAGSLLFDKVRTTFRFLWVRQEELSWMLSPELEG